MQGFWRRGQGLASQELESSVIAVGRGRWPILCSGYHLPSYTSDFHRQLCLCEAHVVGLCVFLASIIVACVTIGPCCASLCPAPLASKWRGTLLCGLREHDPPSHQPLRAAGDTCRASFLWSEIRREIGTGALPSPSTSGQAYLCCSCLDGIVEMLKALLYLFSLWPSFILIADCCSENQNKSNKCVDQTSQAPAWTAAGVESAASPTSLSALLQSPR